MKRRTLLVQTAAGAGIIASGPWNARAATTPTRVNFKTLSPQDVTLFAAAVDLMQSRPAHEPGSWDSLACTHARLPIASNAELEEAAKGEPFYAMVGAYIDFDKLAKVPASAQTTWNTCIHHGDRDDKVFKHGHFQSWHRLYLLTFEAFFIEALGQVAKAKGVTPGFNALPYWDYFTDPVIPAPFRRQKIGGSHNPLYIGVRDPELMSGARGVGASPQAMAATDLLHQKFGSADDPILGFDGLSEALPHDSIHGQLSGLMGAVQTAAWDPIFWVHHCNIDRMWAAWTARQPSKNAAPDADQNWKNEAFIFITTKGQVLWHAEMSMQTVGYQYDSLVVAGTPPSPPPKPPLLKTNASTGIGPGLLSVPQRVEVTSQGGTIVLPLAGTSAKSKLSALALGGPQAAGAPTSLYVVFDGLKITSEGQRRSLVFDVQVSIKAKPGATPAVPVSIGSINKFTLSAKRNQTTVRFQITKVAKDVAAKTGSFSPSNVEVMLVPVRLTTPDGTPSDPTPSGPLIQFKSVHLEALNDM